MAKLTQRDRLEKLLSQDISTLVSQERAKVDRIVADSMKSLVLFGAGQLGKISLASLRQQGVEPIAFADNNPQLWGRSVDGLKVISPQEAAKQFAQKAIFVVTVYTSEPVRQQLMRLGVRVVTLASIAWKYPAGLLPYGVLVDVSHKIFREADDVRKTFELWADDASQREYLTQLEWRLSPAPDVLTPHLPVDQIYFPNDLTDLSPDEVFVDCGAFDGDTIRGYLQRQGSHFKHIIAIEPDRINYQKLLTSFSAFPESIRSRLIALNLAVGAREETVQFNMTGTMGSAIGTGTYKVECMPLDTILKDRMPTYIKMDVEGAEPDALAGAHQVLEKYLPVLAISVYHRQEHLWQIPLLIQSVSQDYRLFLRRYCDECWESICYAIPTTRLRQ